MCLSLQQGDWFFDHHHVCILFVPVHTYLVDDVKDVADITITIQMNCKKSVWCYRYLHVPALAYGCEVFS